MKRCVLLFAVLGLCLSPLVAAAADPYYGIKFVETRKQKVEITSVDPEGLGKLMDLQIGDTVVSVGCPSLDKKMTIQTNDDLANALKNLRGKYEITVIRPLDEKGSKTQEKTLKGEIKESKTGKEFYILRD
jgi:hypothetical protein